ncbi:MAG TPA: LptF/LptG family permease [Terriglobales bacterium]|jgi:LPS export ABC transporter permease LptF/LPS export ABC transporter permease LptG|nr:LptF/LptG family permease [Terriglobales bacterium]
MRILRRYILGEVTSHALIGTGIFTFVIFTKELGQILELVVRNSAPLPSAIQLFLLIIPGALTITLPAGVLIGVLLGLSRLAADSEITAMKACGVSLSKFLRVLSIFFVGAWMLALLNSIYLAPRSQQALSHLQERLKGSQVSFEIQPRVFYEGFPKKVLYVHDVKTAQGAAIWKGVFIADTTDPAAPKITLAERGILVSEGKTLLHLHLINGSSHETVPNEPGKYQISTFQETDMPISLPESSAAKDQPPSAIGEVPTFQLPALAHTRKNPAIARWYWIEFHRRFALPTACLVLGLVGFPLGMSAKKGGKSTGFVLTVVLVFGYYFVSLLGVSLARQGKLSAGAGVWLADCVCLGLGVFLIWRSEKRPFEITALKGSWASLKARFQRGELLLPKASAENAFERASTRTRFFLGGFPMILDDYVLRDFVFNFALIMGSLTVLSLILTVFELLGDILKNQVSPWVVGEYLLNVTPFFLYNTAQYGVLLSVLITLGLMQRSNEVTAMKATGISIYRIIVPVLVAAILVSAGLFLSDQLYLPHTNKRQDALLNKIKGRPPQTYLNPSRKWIFGQNSTIYYYQLFDSDRNQFGDLSVFQFQPNTFQLLDRIYANRAQWDGSLKRWVCAQGWERSFQGSAINEYRTYDVSTFSSVNEPPEYFKKEVKQSLEMNYEQLRRYIYDLQQSGFEVVKLKVQLQKKIAFPIVTFVMGVLAIPFALSQRKRGAVAGVATAIGIAVIYTVVSGLFESMGNISSLPPVLAAWSPDVIFALVGVYLVLKVPT